MKQGLLRKLKTDGTRWLPMFLENTNSDSSYHGNKQKAWQQIESMENRCTCNFQSILQ